jgi:hypothetical protein
LAPNLRAVGIGIAKYKGRRHAGADPERLVGIWLMSDYGEFPPFGRDAVDERDARAAEPEPQPEQAALGLPEEDQPL